MEVFIEGRKIFLKTEYDPELIEKIKSLPGRRWHPGIKVWSVPLTTDNIEALIKKIGVRNAQLIDIYRQEVQKVQIPEDVEILDYEFKTKPYKHQKIMFHLARQREEFAFLCETGTGKTKAAIDVVRYRYQKGLVKKCLVVAPNSVLGSWGREIELHAGLPYRILQGPRKRRIQLLQEPAVFYVINYEGMRILVDELIEAEFDMVIFDESHRIKNPSAQQTKAAWKIAERVKYRMIMTGTPMTNTPLDIYAQFKALDLGKTFGTSFYAYRNKYFVNVGFNFPDWQLKPGALNEISERIYRKAVRFLKKDCLDLPEKIYQVREVELTSQQRKVYHQLKHEMIAELENEEVVTAPIILTRLLRLSQITSGFVKTESGTIHEFKPNPKLEELKSLMEELIWNDKKVVIWAHFQHDIELIAETFKHLNPAVLYGKTKDKYAQVEKFQKDPTCRLFVGQPHSGGIGITLTAADTVIYYSQSYSLEDRLQSEDRTHRIGTKSTVIYIDIIAKETIDEKIRQALMRKQELAKIVTKDFLKEV